MRKRCWVIVIVEDEHHEMLIRRYLRKCGIETRAMRIRRSPSGEGSAEQWVRKTFVDEVGVYRHRHAQTKLIVAIDADTHTVQQRLAQLDQALRDREKPAVDTNAEQIARLIPKRNVETWISSLNGAAVDEQTDYKATKDNYGDLIPQAAKTLFEWTRPNAVLPKHCIDSLRMGASELNRIGF
jgi:hypothetical protein